MGTAVILGRSYQITKKVLYGIPKNEDVLTEFDGRTTTETSTIGREKSGSKLSDRWGTSGKTKEVDLF